MDRLKLLIAKLAVRHYEPLLYCLQAAREVQQKPMSEEAWEDFMGEDGWLNEIFDVLKVKEPQ